MTAHVGISARLIPQRQRAEEAHTKTARQELKNKHATPHIHLFRISGNLIAVKA